MAITINGNGTITGLSSLPDSAMSSGSVIQTVTGTTSTQVTDNDTTAIDTGLSATITTTSNNNKVIVLVSQDLWVQRYNTVGTFAAYIKLLRDSTTLLTQIAGGGDSHSNGDAWNSDFGTHGIICQDSPGNAGSYTYKTQFYCNNSSTVAYAQMSGTQTSTITLLEIKV